MTLERLEQEILNMEKEYQSLSNLVNGNTLLGLLFQGKTMNEARQLIMELKNKKDVLEQEIKEKKINYWYKKIDTINPQKDYKYYLSIVLLIRDENEYLEEWLDWYINTIKVDHIYIYDNESKIRVEDFIKETCPQYLDKLTIIYWRKTQHIQTDAYNDALKKYATETKWMAVFDTDEFLHCKTDLTIQEYLKQHEYALRVSIMWAVFNANGCVNKEDKPVQERFTTQVKNKTDATLGKPIVQPALCDHWVSHWIYTNYDDPLKVREKDSQDLFQLNHYYTRSYEEWMEKMSRGSCVRNFGRSIKDFFLYNPDLSHLNTGVYIEQLYNGTDPLRD